jgi:hypothetical protein
MVMAYLPTIILPGPDGPMMDSHPGGRNDHFMGTQRGYSSEDIKGWDREENDQDTTIEHDCLHRFDAIRPAPFNPPVGKCFLAASVVGVCFFVLR